MRFAVKYNDRQIAYQVLLDVQREQAYSNLALNCFISENPECNPPFIRELVYGVLRNQLLLDYNIDRYVKKCKLSDRILLRLGFYQLCFMNSVSDYAAVNETVNLARGSKSFINAVLRNFIRDGKELKYDSLSTQYSCHESIVGLFTKAYGEEKTVEILRHSLQTPVLTSRVNKSGLISIQGKSSQKAVEVLNPKPGEKLIDMCAAPGGKSLYAADLMENQGEIVAFDLYEHRVKLIDNEANRLGFNIIKTAVKDSTVFDESLIETADAIICDVPCSGFGTIAKKPEIKLKGISSQLPDLYDIQYKILENAGKYVKRGGRILYSTCTLNPKENNEQVLNFVNNNNGYSLVFEEQIFPHDEFDGFYISIIKRNSND